jgi:hypothetical protein
MTIVAFGTYQDPRPLALTERVQRAKSGAIFVRDMAALHHSLAESRPHCVVMDSPTALREVARILRQSEHTRGVPLLVLVDRVSARLMLSLHADGADDVVQLGDLDGLSRRIASFAEHPAAPSRGPFKGECVLAHPDVARLAEFGHVLHQAGFEVLPATNAAEVQEAIEQRSPAVMVISSTLPPEGGRRALRRLSETADRDVPAVLLAAGNPGPFSPQGWAVVAEEAPPQNLLFVVNDLTRPAEQTDGRESRRLLYSTLCNFRVAGELESTPGLTYNIGRGGLFVRTLAPPPRRAAVWLELAPPGGNQAVQLRAEVAWSTPFSNLATGAPPGFGAQLVPGRGAAGDFAQYVAQYGWLLDLVTASNG